MLASLSLRVATEAGPFYNSFPSMFLCVCACVCVFFLTTTISTYYQGVFWSCRQSIFDEMKRISQVDVYGVGDGARN